MISRSRITNEVTNNKKPICYTLGYFRFNLTDSAQDSCSQFKTYLFVLNTLNSNPKHAYWVEVLVPQDRQQQDIMILCSDPSPGSATVNILPRFTACSILYNSGILFCIWCEDTPEHLGVHTIIFNLYLRYPNVIMPEVQRATKRVGPDRL